MKIANTHFPTFNNNNYDNTETQYMSGYRNKAYIRKVSSSDKIKAITGSLIGTTIPMAIMMKKQKIKNPLKLEYGMWDMVGMSAGSITGGVALGLVGKKKRNKSKSLKRRVFPIYECSHSDLDCRRSIKFM